MSQPDVNIPFPGERENARIDTMLELLKLILRDNRELTLEQVVSTCTPGLEPVTDDQMIERLQYVYRNYSEGYMVVPAEWSA